MTKIMPQELDVWYLIPAIRRELTRIFTKEKGLSQKEASVLLGLTESAISQYLKFKRAEEVKFSQKEKTEIRKVAEKIVNDRKNSTKYVYNLSLKLRKAKCLCGLHKRHDSGVPINCNVCRN